MDNLFYSVVDIDINHGGPKTRVSAFKKVFEDNNNVVIIGNNKIRKSIEVNNINLIYIESATNRIKLIDFICLLILKFKSKRTIVFIRDVYIELFPDNYRGLRGSITKVANKISNLFLTTISSKMVFPTTDMGEIFFKSNKIFPKREYTALPPGTIENHVRRKFPNFKKKLGILYLGSTQYTNSGFKHFLDFAEKFNVDFNFYVLSKDNISYDPKILTKSYCEREFLAKYINDNNIAYAFHTRPRNQYDDLTFPIKVLDFISLELPFITEMHKPIVNLLGDNYKLYVEYNNTEKVSSLLKSLSIDEYRRIMNDLYCISITNTYKNRYQKLCNM